MEYIDAQGIPVSEALTALKRKRIEAYKLAEAGVSIESIAGHLKCKVPYVQTMLKAARKEAEIAKAHYLIYHSAE